MTERRCETCAHWKRNPESEWGECHGGIPQPSATDAAPVLWPRTHQAEYPCAGYCPLPQVQVRDPSLLDQLREVQAQLAIVTGERDALKVDANNARLAANLAELHRSQLRHELSQCEQDLGRCQAERDALKAEVEYLAGADLNADRYVDQRDEARRERDAAEEQAGKLLQEAVGYQRERDSLRAERDAALQAAADATARALDVAELNEVLEAQVESLRRTLGGS